MEEEYYRIIKRPLITEKTTLAKDAHNKVTFVVARDANKIQIKQAVEHLFDVKVKQVRTMSVHGKVKRLGLHQGNALFTTLVAPNLQALRPPAGPVPARQRHRLLDALLWQRLSDL